MLPIKHLSRWLVYTVMTLFIAHASAAPAPKIPNLNKCNNKNSLTVVPVQDLSFGDFDGAVAGTITVTPAGARNSSGPDLAGGTVTPAAFDVSNLEPGCDIYPVQITLPGTASLTGTGTPMLIDNFVSSPASQFTLSPTPGQATRVFIGATLNSGANQTSGGYTTVTPFDVTFDHIQ